MANEPSLFLRVILDPDTLLGPGKADLLQGIQETGSIAGAGRRMGPPPVEARPPEMPSNITASFAHG
jgi:molybdenum-dependent DNA-binding transcriptional regulator ModE